MNRNEVGERRVRKLQAEGKEHAKEPTEEHCEPRKLKEGLVTGARGSRRTQQNRRLETQAGPVGSMRNVVLIPRVT